MNTMQSGTVVPDVLTIIENLSQEHEAIEWHMKSVGVLARDWMGMDWDDQTSLSHEQLQTLNSRCLNLKQTMHSLEEGMRNHWDHEEKVLPDLIGPQLMKSISIEHDEIRRQMREINYALANSTPQELLTSRDYLESIISHLCHLINEHEKKENTVLQLIKRQYI